MKVNLNEGYKITKYGIGNYAWVHRGQHTHMLLS
jgi:hypothetical protein